jgi:hypothetical protein
MLYRKEEAPSTFISFREVVSSQNRMERKHEQEAPVSRAPSGALREASADICLEPPRTTPHLPLSSPDPQEVHKAASKIRIEKRQG